MEKTIDVIARYHCADGYFVEVSMERSATARRDYWLCKRNNVKKMFMFSSRYKNDRTEENEIIEHYRDCVMRYESTMLTKFA